MVIGLNQLIIKTNCMRCIVIGGTGAVGKVLLNQLAANPNIDKIISVQRRETEAINKKVEVLVADLQNLQQLKLTDEIDAAFCCLGTTIKKAKSKANFEAIDYQMVVDFANVVLKKNVKSFSVVSSMGAKKNALVFYNQVKGKMEETLKAMGFVSIGIFRPSLLINRGDFRFGEKVGEVIMMMLSPVLRGPFKKFAAISVKKVATAMVWNALTNPFGLRIYESDQIHAIAEFSSRKGKA
tara:strand:+ start:5321 stop:6037 length:717 start_codon:yes stop_codon:yes gene_type:complete